MDKWKNFFESRSRSFHVSGEPLTRTLFGTFYVLYPEDQFGVEIIDGYNVAPLEETVEFCKRKMYSYEPALEMLDQMYSLGWVPSIGKPGRTPSDRDGRSVCREGRRNPRGRNKPD